MYKIAICDDSIKDLHATVGMVREYTEYHQGVAFEIHQYTATQALQDHIESGRVFDLYILDVLFPRGTSFELALSIKEHQSKANLIFATISPDYSLAAFDVLALRYLLEPIERNRLFEAIEYACMTMSLREDKRLLFKSTQGVCHISYNDILYAECRDRTIVLKCRDDITFRSCYIRSSFEKELAPLLEDASFLQSHKSFIINMNHIEHLREQTVIFDNGDVIPIAHLKKSQVKRTYLEYVSP